MRLIRRFLRYLFFTIDTQDNIGQVYSLHEFDFSKNIGILNYSDTQYIQKTISEFHTELYSDNQVCIVTHWLHYLQFKNG